MTTTVTAIFDGEVLRPDVPVALEPNKRYSLIIHALPNGDGQGNADVWGLLDELSGQLDAPEDWAAEHDHYLYGSPKRQSN